MYASLRSYLLHYFRYFPFCIKVTQEVEIEVVSVLSVFCEVGMCYNYCLLRWRAASESSEGQSFLSEQHVVKDQSRILPKTRQQKAPKETVGLTSEISIVNWVMKSLVLFCIRWFVWCSSTAGDSSHGRLNIDMSYAEETKSLAVRVNKAE